MAPIPSPPRPQITTTTPRMRPPVRPTPRPSPPRAERRPTPSGRPSPAASAAGSHAQLLDRRDLRDGDHAWELLVHGRGDGQRRPDGHAGALDRRARPAPDHDHEAFPEEPPGRAYSASVQASGGKTPTAGRLRREPPAGPRLRARPARSPAPRPVPGRTPSRSARTTPGRPVGAIRRRSRSRSAPPAPQITTTTLLDATTGQAYLRPSPPRAERRPTPSGRPSPAACCRVSRSTPRPARSPGRRPRPGATRSRSR